MVTINVVEAILIDRICTSQRRANLFLIAIPAVLPGTMLIVLAGRATARRSFYLYGDYRRR